MSKNTDAVLYSALRRDRRKGESLTAQARRLGIGATTLEKWMKDRPKLRVGSKMVIEAALSKQQAAPTQAHGALS